MKIIIFSEAVGHKNSYVFSLWKFMALVVVAVLVLVMVASWISWDLAQRQQHSTVVSDLRRQSEVQKKDLMELKSTAQSQMDLFSKRLAELQGRLLRLDALGERLIHISDLDSQEFDFSKPPAVGGPESEVLDERYNSSELMFRVDELLDEVDQRQIQLKALENLLHNRQLEDDIAIAGRPIEKGWLSSRFGKRVDPFTGRLAYHKGVDFAGRDGANVIAVGAGIITWAGARSGYGNLVEINHGNGYVTRYAHNKSVKVAVGNIVEKGDVIALMGSTGRSTGPHVHFEVLRNGVAVNPEKYIYRASR